MTTPGEPRQPTGPLFDVTAREDTRSPVAGRPARPWQSVRALAPAAVLVGVMLLAPLVATVVTSLWGGFGHYEAVLGDRQTRHAFFNSLRWLAVAPLVCAVGFALAWVGRGTRRSRTFLVGVIAAPMAVSALVTGITFRMMFDPQPDHGVATAISSVLSDWVGGTSPLPGARPDPDGVLFVDPPGAGPREPQRALFAVDKVSGDLTTAAVTPGQAVDLTLTGVPTPSGPPLAASSLPHGVPGEVDGVVTVRGRPVAGVPVSIHRLDFVEHATTDGRGRFRFDVAGQPAAEDARYVLHIPAAAVAPRSAGVNFLGPNWIGWVLASAFVWAWAGFAVVVFRMGFAAVPRDLARMARAFGVGRTRTALTITVPALIPVTAVVLLTLLVAAVRVFDLVLVGAPGSVQANADVIGLHWWRAAGSTPAGDSAALAVLLFLLVALFAGVALWGMTREWPSSADRHESPTGRSPIRRWAARVVGTVAMALWLVPFGTLLLTSLRSPHDAAVGGWWMPGRDGLGLASYQAAFDTGQLGPALWATAERATMSTALVLVVAFPAAHALACGALSARTQAVLTAVTAILAVVPVQAVAGPLETAFNWLHLSGSPTLLTITHGAFGVPFAVLLLRPALRAAMRRDAPGARSGWGGQSGSRLALVGQVWTTLLAVAVLEFVFVWNDLVVGLILSGPRSGSLMLALFGQVREFDTASGVLAASGVVGMVVPLTLVLVTGRWVVRGLAAGVLR